MQECLQTAGEKSKFNGRDESRRLIDRSKLGHIPVWATKALQETGKEDLLTLCLSKEIEVWIQIKTTFNITYTNRGTAQKCPIEIKIWINARLHHRFPSQEDWWFGIQHFTSSSENPVISDTSLRFERDSKSGRFFKGRLLTQGQKKQRPVPLSQNPVRWEAPSDWPFSSRAFPNSQPSQRCTNHQAARGYSGQGCALVLKPGSA